MKLQMHVTNVPQTHAKHSISNEFFPSDLCQLGQHSVHFLSVKQAAVCLLSVKVHADPLHHGCVIVVLESVMIACAAHLKVTAHAVLSIAMLMWLLI